MKLFAADIGIILPVGSSFTPSDPHWSARLDDAVETAKKFHDAADGPLAIYHDVVSPKPVLYMTRGGYLALIHGKFAGIRRGPELDESDLPGTAVRLA